MKFSKITILAAGAALMMGLASCSDVTDPVYTKPDAATFKLNTPPLQNQYYALDPEGTFEIVCNGQPDYGFSVVTQYRAEVSLTENFAEYKTLIPTGTGTMSRMVLRDNDLAIAMCELRGIYEEDDYTDAGQQKVYFRGVAFISGIDDSYVTTSNVVSLNNVQGYFANSKPGYIFCIGNYAGSWIGPTEDNATNLEPYSLFEADDAIGSKIYSATIDFGENAPIFRFYTSLSGWDTDSYGPEGGTDSDTPVVFDDFKAGSTLSKGLAATKDSFSFPNYSGSIEMKVDMSSSTPSATLKAVE